MPKNLWPVLAKGAAGFVAGGALWLALSAPYATVLAALSEPLVRALERPSVTHLVPRGTELTIERLDFAPGSSRPGVSLMDLTFNVILLTTLFAASPKPLGDRNILGLFLSSLVLVAVHVAAVVMKVQAISALQFGLWSEVHYGPVARNFWGAAAHFYRLIGGFGAAFALWWLFRPPQAAADASVRSVAGWKRRQSRTS